jgi:hypothetical protein
MYVDQFAEEHTKLEGLKSLDSGVPGYRRESYAANAAKESAYRFVAYASPYLFWTTVLGLSMGVLLI